MYPQVFADFLGFRATYDDLTGLPSSAFFFGLKIGEEIHFEFETGKTLFIKLISMSMPDQAGRRTLFYELNGMPRESTVVDKALKPAVAARPKGDPANPAHIRAPMPGAVTEVAVSPGQQVLTGDKLVVIEAMKMLTTVSAPADTTVKSVLVKRGDTIDTDDLLIELT
jgi:pyruvate carboxylase